MNAKPRELAESAHLQIHSTSFTMMAMSTTIPTFSNIAKSSNLYCNPKPISKQRSSITNTTHRSSIFTNYTTGDGNSLASASIGEMSNNKYTEGMLPDVHVLRRADNEGTAPTMFSVVSRSDRSSNHSIHRRETPPSRLLGKSSSFLRFLAPSRRRKQLSEDQLRKQIKRHCENRDWSKVRKLISNHDFTEVPEVVLETNSVAAKSSSSEGRQSQTMEPVHASRRPSYGSRSGERLSFTGKESSAAADAMKVAAAMALLEEHEESSSSEELSQKAKDVCDENILHDVCSHNPPRDVIELLLAAMRHRRGSTCSRDRHGRTPLHVAVATGASSGVIDALTRADPLAATMGDADQRSPLHLAVKYLAYDERYAKLAAQSKSKQSLFKLKKSSKTPPSHSVLSREDSIEDTRQIVVILKNTMMTYPGQIDFKDEDSSGFAPLDYAIDGSINDRTILRCLLRRDKSQDIRRRSTYQSDETDKTPKTRNSVAAKLAKQSSDRTAGSMQLRRRRRSTQSCSSVSTLDSLQSQDKELVHQIENEEIESRKHRINRINARKQKNRMQEGLLDLFGIDGEAAQAIDPLAMNLEPVPSSPEMQDNFNSSYRSSENPAVQPKVESILLTAQPDEQPESRSAGNDMTEEEIYMHHLQAYLNDNMGDVYGDLEYCDDLDFLLEDPDELDDKPMEISDGSTHEDHILIFEISITHEHNPHHFDDCSEISCS
jgi:hypothetical protein